MNNSLKEKMSAYALLTEESLRKYFKETDSDYSVIAEAQLYSLLAGGKRVRPFLVYEFCSLFGGKEEDASHLAAAIEMIHTFSLIHDDLPCMDNDILRRGRNTCHIEFDEATALLAGDALSIAAFELISDSNLAPMQIKRSVKLLSSLSGWRGMIGGQIIDLSGEKKVLSFETLKKLHLLKTACLIKCACLLGCVAANISENDKRYKSAEKFADAIGLAFQIKDDILDKISTKEELGKTVGKDENSKKTTFLTYMSIEKAENKVRELTITALSAIKPYDGNEILSDFALYLAERKS